MNQTNGTSSAEIEAPASRSGLPVYEVVRRVLAHEIESGLYEDGLLLPSETELGKRFDVSRITIRNAVSQLVSAGLVHRRQGIGTFVTPRHVKRASLNLGWVTSEAPESSGKWEKKIVVSERQSASPRVASLLEIPTGSSVFHLVRIFKGNGLPSFTDETHYPLERFPDFDRLIVDETSTYETLEKAFHVKFMRNVQELGISYCTAETAEYLACLEHEALLRIDKIAFDAADVPIHLSRLECVPSRMVLSVGTNAQAP